MLSTEVLFQYFPADRKSRQESFASFSMIPHSYSSPDAATSAKKTVKMKPTIQNNKNIPTFIRFTLTSLLRLHDDNVSTPGFRHQ